MCTKDLFGEGTFTGKGIYDVDIFRRATDGRFPDNSLLSHDLIEGAFARAGLVTDVEVFDDYPTRYLTSTRRMHRWIRGDWQLLRWLTSRVPGRVGSNQDPLSTLSRWKIADNMRRSLTPVAQLVWFVAGLTLLPGLWVPWGRGGASWRSELRGSRRFLVFAAARPPREQAWRPYYSAIAHDGSRALQQLGLAVVVLPDQALLAIDAIARTSFRVLRSRRRMLEWQTASNTEETTGEQPSFHLAAHVAGGGAWRPQFCPSLRGADRSIPCADRRGGRRQWRGWHLHSRGYSCPRRRWR